jgi:hypothetical protein
MQDSDSPQYQKTKQKKGKEKKNKKAHVILWLESEHVLRTLIK